MSPRVDVTDLVGRALARHASGAGPVSADHNFFEAGFTSVTLTKVLADLRAPGLGFVPELTLIDLFRFPTRRLLAAELRRRLDPAGATAGPRTMPWDTRPR